MRKSGKIVAAILDILKKSIEPGIITEELDAIAVEELDKLGAVAAFKGYRGYPASVCVSVDSEVVHGIPGKRVLNEGELVSLDIGVELNGFFSDAAKTYGIGDITQDRRELMEATLVSLHRGIKKCRTGNRLMDISHAIQSYVESRGFSVVRALVGHGIGRELHEEPQVPNVGRPGQGPPLMEGLVLAVEPMLSAGTDQIRTLEDRWTVVTSDLSRSAHFEHTIAVTEDGPMVLTGRVPEGYQVLSGPVAGPAVP